MGANYTEEEFAAKVDEEGGLWGAIAGYGLSSTDLADQNTELAESIAALETVLRNYSWLIDSIHINLDDALTRYQAREEY